MTAPSQAAYLRGENMPHFEKIGATFYRDGKVCETGEDIADAIAYFESVEQPAKEDVFLHRTRDCGQPERDKEILRKAAGKYAVMALAHFPEDYESRKRIITNAIVAALTAREFAL